MAGNEAPNWDFVVAPVRSVPGVASMVGYRARDIPDGIHLGMPSATLTFIVSLDDGVESADSAAALDDARPNPLVLGGLHTRAPHIRQRPGQAGIQLAVHPLASVPCSGCPAQNCRSPISRDSRFWVVLWPACRNGPHGNVAGRMRSIPSRPTSRSRGGSARWRPSGQR